MEDQQRILLCNLKPSAKFADNLLSGAICLETLRDKRLVKLIYEYHGKNYLNVKVVCRKQPNEYGKSHYIEVDMFVPKGKEEKLEVAK